MDVVIDTNVIVSGLISQSSAPGHVLHAAVTGRFRWIVSAALMSELERVLSYSKVRRAIRKADKDIKQFLRDVSSLASHVLTAQELHILADEPDNRVLETAIAGGADYIVTGDKHLLDLHEYEGIEIITPARFAAILAGV
ncbi:MAG: putative toxin-antitoxin system toxin component, PIN family [Chloroflexota bacterium]